MAKIFNVKVYGLTESLIRSGYPKSTVINENMDMLIANHGDPLVDSLIGRGTALGNAKPGSGHDCFLKGIIVQADFHAPQYWWQQAQRYHWFDIVSSQSKMHRILEMDLRDCCNDSTYDDAIRVAMKAVRECKEDRETFEEILSTIPMGFEYTAGVSTNYLQLKTMYHQRRYHRLTMWNKVFVEFCEALPYFNELCGGTKND